MRHEARRSPRMRRRPPAASTVPSDTGPRVGRDAARRRAHLASSSGTLPRIEKATEAFGLRWGGPAVDVLILPQTTGSQCFLPTSICRCSIHAIQRMIQLHVRIGDMNGAVHTGRSQERPPQLRSTKWPVRGLLGPAACMQQLLSSHTQLDSSDVVDRCEALTRDLQHLYRERRQQVEGECLLADTRT
jgi:hypothetical protein